MIPSPQDSWSVTLLIGACLPTTFRYIFSKLSKFIVNVGRVTEAVDNAIEDNVVTPEEVTDIKSKIGDAVDSGKDLVNAIRK